MNLTLIKIHGVEILHTKLIVDVCGKISFSVVLENAKSQEEKYSGC